MSHGKRGESSLGAMVKKHLSSISIFEKEREREPLSLCCPKRTMLGS